MRIKISEDEIFLPEPVGKQPKYWFRSYNEMYLFKLATLKQDGSPVYNDVSECMAADLARYLNIPTAEYYLCEKEGEKGVITKDFLNNKPEGMKEEEFFDGVHLIQNIDPGFKNKSLINPQTHQYYTVDLILRTVEKYGLRKDALNMIIFDALIGNRDRNPSNYGIIINHKYNTVRFAPLYDSCASLGVSMVEHRLNKCFNKKGMIIDGNHLDVVVHKHIVGKVTLDRFLQYKDKRAWDREEEKRILTLIEQRRSELLPLLESNKISNEQYHKELNKVGNEYRRFDIGFVFQFYNLVANLTAKENVDLATQISKDAVSSEEVLKMVGLEDRMDNFPSQLSGGEQQRVSIARALAKRPKLLLCDEPTGALDYNTGKTILKLLQDTCRNSGMTIVVITHNQAIAPMADRIIKIKNSKVSSVKLNENPVDVSTIEW